MSNEPTTPAIVVEIETEEGSQNVALTNVEKESIRDIIVAALKKHGIPAAGGAMVGGALGMLISIAVKGSDL